MAFKSAIHSGINDRLQSDAGASPTANTNDTLAGGQTGQTSGPPPCFCPNCGTQIPADSLAAQGYSPDASGGEPDADDYGMPTAGAGTPPTAGMSSATASAASPDDMATVNKFNAGRPAFQQANPGRAAGLLSTARRMKDNNQL